MKKVFALCLALALSLSLMACASSTSNSAGSGESSSPAVEYTTVKSIESNLSLKFPTTWKHTDLNDDASIGLALPSKEYYYVVIEEKNTDFPAGFTLGEYIGIVSTSMSGAVENAKLSSTQDVEIAQGIKAKQFDLAGSMQAGLQTIDVKYLVTCFEAEGSFYQLIAWTLEKDFADAKPTFDEITNSASFTSA